MKQSLFIAVLVFNFSQVVLGGSRERYFVRFKTNVSEDRARELIAENDFTLQNRLREIDWYVVQNENKGRSNFDALSKLKAQDAVDYAEEVTPVELYETPNDPFFSAQFDLTRIRMREAWGIQKGSDDIIVAVVDTGVDISHPDLKKQIWTNRKEILNNGKDDDLNGFIDDANGWNFYDNNNNVADPNSHGSHVAGIIGADTNNSIGVSGINWNVRIMPLRFTGPDGSGSTEYAVYSILYAIRNGARVINASWGSTSYSRALADAISFGYHANVLFVAAAGNSQVSTDEKSNYPSGLAIENIVAVAASSRNDELASFSNWGPKTVHLAAPGLGTLSTLAKGAYGTMSGTSMAAPMVSGIAALILASHPDLTVTSLKNAILNGVQRYAKIKDRVSTGGHIDALRALEQFEEGFQVWPKTLSLAEKATYTFTAHQAQGPIVWSSSNPAVASINDSGTLVTLGPGKVIVTATDSLNRIAQTDPIIVLEGALSSPGCGKALDQRISESEKLFVTLNLALPLFVGFLVRARFGRRRHPRSVPPDYPVV